MDKKLQLLAHLYGEAGDATPLPELLRDPELAAEHQAMSEAKFWLDHAVAEKPDPEVVARILAAAAPVASAPASQTDRPPAPRAATRSPHRSWRVAATAMSLLAIAAFFIFNQTPALEQATVSDNWIPETESLAKQAAPALREEMSPADSGLQLADAAAESVQSSELRSQESLPPSRPTWGEVDVVIQYKSRIDQMMEQSADLSWDEPVPLESLSGATPAAPPAGLRLNEASSTRTSRGQ